MKHAHLTFVALVLTVGCENLGPEGKSECGDQSCQFPETEETCPDDCSTCGDGRCILRESHDDFLFCAADCTVCGDTRCTGNETLTSCPQDCTTCGDGRCAGQETQTSCRVDCPLCGDDVCGATETEATCLQDCCIPDCSGRECGMDPKCNTPCGAMCMDGNRCTTDSCGSDGLCDATPVTTVSAQCVDEYIVSYCDGGAEQTADCVALCIPDTNAVEDCSGGCTCVNFSTTSQCNGPGTNQVCTSGNDLAVCEWGGSHGVNQYFWHIKSCTRVCREGGYSRTTDCNSNGFYDVCRCAN